VNLTDARPIVLVTGISASGKSTVAELLARPFDRSVHVRGDLFRRMVVAGRHEMTAVPSDEARRQLGLRYRLGAHTANTFHDAGFAVVVQDVVLGPPLADYAAALHGRPLVVVVLVPDPAVVARREAARSKVAYRDGAPAIAALDEALRRETPRIGLWLDTSSQTPDQTVDEIVARALTDGVVPSSKFGPIPPS
jgi:chloramphenicol 3-O-phosphotransferase